MSGVAEPRVRLRFAEGLSSRRHQLLSSDGGVLGPFVCLFCVLLGFGYLARGLLEYVAFGPSDEATFRQQAAGPLRQSGLIVLLVASVALVLASRIQRNASRLLVGALCVLFSLGVLAWGNLAQRRIRHPWPRLDAVLRAAPSPTLWHRVGDSHVASEPPSSTFAWSAGGQSGPDACKQLATVLKTWPGVTSAGPDPYPGPGIFCHFDAAVPGIDLSATVAAGSAETGLYFTRTLVPSGPGPFIEIEAKISPRQDFYYHLPNRPLMP